MHVCLGLQHSCSWIIHIAWLLKYKITYLVFIGVLDSDPWRTFKHPWWSWGSGGKLKLSPCQMWIEIITWAVLKRSFISQGRRELLTPALTHHLRGHSASLRIEIPGFCLRASLRWLTHLRDLLTRTFLWPPPFLPHKGGFIAWLTCLHLNRSNVYILWIVMTHFIVQCKAWVCIVRGDLEPSQRNSLKGVISSCKGWNRSGGIAFVRHLQWPTTHSLQIPSLIRSFSKTNGFNGHNGHCLTDSEHLDIVF